MPCTRQEQANLREFLREMGEIDRKIASGELKLRRAANGKVEIVGWAQTGAARVGWTDTCLLARLQIMGSQATKTKIRALTQVPRRATLRR